MEALQKWITGVEMLLDSEPFHVTDIEILEEQLNQYQVSFLII